MKKIFFLFALTGLYFFAYSQAKGSVQLYGFQQNVSGGKAPEMAEDTELRVSEGAGRNYFLYAASSSRIYPVEIWIGGVRYGATIKPVETPVEYGDERNIGSPKKVLIPKTDKKVIQLILVPAGEEKAVGTRAKTLAGSNDLVLVYKQNGKFYFNTLKTLSNLEQAAAQ